MQIVSAFPGCGKTTLSKKHPNINDSDSSHFDKRYFPGNYLDHIQALYDRGACTLVSSHALVREGLAKRALPFILAYPAVDCKAEYLERYRLRGSPQAFIDLLDKNWESWIAECENQRDCIHIRLMKGQYLSDVIKWGFHL